MKIKHIIVFIICNIIQNNCLEKTNNSTILKNISKKILDDGKIFFKEHFSNNNEYNTFIHRCIKKQNNKPLVDFYNKHSHEIKLISKIASQGVYFYILKQKIMFFSIVQLCSNNIVPTKAIQNTYEYINRYRKLPGFSTDTIKIILFLIAMGTVAVLSNKYKETITNMLSSNYIKCGILTLCIFNYILSKYVLKKAQE